MNWKQTASSLLAALLLLGSFAGCKKAPQAGLTTQAEPQATALSSAVSTVPLHASSSAAGTLVPPPSQAASAATGGKRTTAPPAAQRQTTTRPKQAGTTAKKPGTSKKPAVNQPVTTPPKTKEEAYEAEVLRLVNEERAKAGLTPLRRSATLASAAMIRTKEIQIQWSHTRPDGSECFTVSDEVYGENLAFGYSTAKQAMAAWMKSQGHRENIMRPQFRTIGVGQQNGYWVQLFGY